jgi:hypothetical protein
LVDCPSEALSDLTFLPNLKLPLADSHLLSTGLHLLPCEESTQQE